MIAARERLIVALDVPSAEAARQIVAAIGDAAVLYKVGMQLYTAEGPQIVRELIVSGKEVFLDLKYHDIPNTVASAVREAAALGVSMLTVHASGGKRMLHAAAESAREQDRQILVLAVTVLTSMDEEELHQIGVGAGVSDHVLMLGGMALEAGCGGLVASAHEAAQLRRRFGQQFAVVTPGVRPAGTARNDQSRVVTPADAIAAGASHIVVGRPITEAADPSAQAKAIIEQMGTVSVTP